MMNYSFGMNVSKTIKQTLHQCCFSSSKLLSFKKSYCRASFVLQYNIIILCMQTSCWHSYLNRLLLITAIWSIVWMDAAEFVLEQCITSVKQKCAECTNDLLSLATFNNASGHWNTCVATPPLKQRETLNFYFRQICMFISPACYNRLEQNTLLWSAESIC